MLSANLLPPSEQEALAYEFKTRATIFAGKLLGATLGIGIALLLPTIIALTFAERGARTAAEEAEKDAVRTGVPTKSQAVAEADLLAGTIIDHEHRRQRVGPVLESIFATVPPGVRLTIVSYRASSHELSIVGKADTRDQYLRFTEALEKNTHTASLRAPIQNLVSNTDISFSLSLTTK
jgi:Tfp pilus assembly protein PilN